MTDSFDSPDGRTYSAPETARQAHVGRAWDEWYAEDGRDRTLLRGFSESKYDAMRRAFHAGAQVAIAAAAPALRSLTGLVSAHFIGNGPYPLQLVCLTEDARDVECDTTICEVEPGATWDELEARIAAHAERHIPATPAAQPKPIDFRTAFARLAGSVRAITDRDTAQKLIDQALSRPEDSE